MNAAILVCCHKKDKTISQFPYCPIHVGKSNSSLDLEMQTDNIGINISKKNDTYCELTGMYWAWKNLKGVDVVGLCHYRRFFDFHHQSRLFLPSTQIGIEGFDNTNFSIPDRVIQRVFEERRVVVAKSFHFSVPLNMEYCYIHYSKDYHILEQIVMESQPSDIQKAFIRVMQRSNSFHPCNMFIMKWDEFDKYCTWLFGLLGTLEKRIDISYYDKQQRRIFGFLGERLLNVWIEARSLKKIEVPVLLFVDHPLNPNPWKILLSNLVKDISNFLIHPWSKV